MALTDDPAMRRVVSRDGAEIAYWTSGEGPPLVAVHGGPADHTRWDPLLPHLEPHVTVHAVDRRGRGASGDGPDYAMARELEDVAAVVEAVAAERGSAVDVYGHSFGAACVLDGAMLSRNIRKIVLYEPPVAPTTNAYPPGLLERLDALLGQGRREEAVELVFRGGLGMSAEEFRAFRAHPSYPARVAAAHTMPREARVEVEGAFDPRLAAEITAPTLLMTGEHSPDFLRADIDTLAAALPDAHVVVFEGPGHVADLMVPEPFVERTIAFLHPRR